MIYFDNAATGGKKPPSVIKAVNNALSEYSANPGRSGHSKSLKTAMAVYSAREKTAEFFGASGPENVVFTANCTAALNYVIKGILNSGDRVVVSSLEHNAVVRPLYKIGVEVDVARASLVDDRLTLAEFSKKITPDTRLVICTGASNVLGKILPITKIGALCKERNIPFAVDGAQIAGVVPIDMQSMNIDYLCLAPHKALYAPMGLGVLICEKPIINTIIEGGTGTNSEEMVQPEFLPERLESGTINVPAIMGLSAGIDYLKQMGITKIYNYEMELMGHLYNSLAGLEKAMLYTPYPMSGMYAPVLSFNIYGRSSTETAEYLSKNGIAVRAGLHCAPYAHKQIGTLDKGTVRVSLSSFNTLYEIKNFINLIRKY